MALLISEIEKRLQSLIEDHLVKYLPSAVFQDLIAQRLSEALRANLSTQGLDGKTNMPHQFTLMVHPSTLSQWQKEPRLMEGLNKIFRLVTTDLGVKFESAPSLTLSTDPLIAIDDLKVQAAKKASVAETQNTHGNADEMDDSVPVRAAFLIVGGTKVFTLQQAVTNIGRRLDNHLVVDDPRVSRYHAQIRYVRGRFIIFDLNSTGGTYVNGQRTSQSALYPGDVVSLAGLPIIFGQDNPPPNTSSGTTAPLAPSTSERTTAVLKNIPTKPEN
jgi:hypothetical protein